MSLDNILDQSSKSIQFEVSEKKEHKIILDNGLIRLPNGNTYKINIQLNNSTTSLSKEQEAVITQSVMDLLNKSENLADYKDLKNTVITHEGIKTDQFIEKEGELSVTTSDKIEDIATNIIIPATIVDFSSTLDKIVSIATSPIFLPPLKSESLSDIKDSGVVIKFDKLDKSEKSEKLNDISEQPQFFKEKRETTNKTSSIFKKFRTNLSRRFQKTRRGIRKRFTQVSDKLKIRNREKSSQVKNVQSQPVPQIESEESRVINKMSLYEINTQIKNLGKDKKIRIVDEKLTSRARGIMPTKPGKGKKSIDVMHAIVSKMKDSVTKNLSSNFTTLESIEESIKTQTEIAEIIKTIEEGNGWAKSVIQNNPELKKTFEMIKTLSNPKVSIDQINQLINNSKEEIPKDFKNLSLKNIEEHLTALDKIQKIKNFYKIDSDKKIDDTHPQDEVIYDILTNIKNHKKELENKLASSEITSFGEGLEELNRIERILDSIKNGEWTKNTIEGNNNLSGKLVIIEYSLMNIQDSSDLISDMLNNAANILKTTMQELGSPLKENPKTSLEEVQKNLKNLEMLEQFSKCLKESKWIKEGSVDNSIELNNINVVDPIKKFHQETRLNTIFDRLLNPQEEDFRTKFLTNYRAYAPTEQLFATLKTYSSNIEFMLEEAVKKEADQDGNISMRLNFKDETVNKQEFIKKLENQQNEIQNVCKEWMTNSFVNSGEKAPQGLLDLMKNTVIQSKPVIEKGSYKPNNELNMHFSKRLVDLTSGELDENDRIGLLRDMSESLFKRDAYLFSQINSKDILSYNSAKPEIDGNIDSMTTAFNNLTNYVALSILVSSTSIEERVRVMEFFIDLADECIKQGNFNAANAIKLAFDQASITRLTETMMKINDTQKEKLKNMQIKLQPMGNYKNVSRDIDERIKNNEPCIPLLSLITNQITTGSEIPTLSNGKINEDKLDVLTKISNLAERPQKKIEEEVKERSYYFKPVFNILDEINLSQTDPAKLISTLSDNKSKYDKDVKLDDFAYSQSLTIQPRK